MKFRKSNWKGCLQNLPTHSKTLILTSASRNLGTVPAGRRVVVTGLGLLTCLGVGVEYVWNNLTAGKCGLSKVKEPGYEKISCKIAGYVPRGDVPGTLNLNAHIPAADQKTMSLASMYALIAAEEALKQANWFPVQEEDCIRTGVAVGMGMVGMDTIVEAGINIREEKYRKIGPYFIPKILVNMAAGNISMKYKFKGPVHSVSTACTTGLHAIGDAARFIKYGDADVMVCGGTEACISPVSIGGFSRMLALCRNFNDDPQHASRPFDKDRNGFVMSEGAGILVLEEYDHAVKRGAKILAEIRGYGLSGDAHHITAPDPDGAVRCMQNALKDANLLPDDISYVNAHATSTPLGDDSECQAIMTVFGNSCSQLRVSSTKGGIGHLLGAAGSVEAIFTILACQRGCLPLTTNLTNPDKVVTFQHIMDTSQEWNAESRTAITNSFGFGGTNGSLCISNVDQ